MTERIAIFLPNWIGDLVMATPMLRTLHAQLGSRAELIGVMRPYVAEVLHGTPWLSSQLLYDPRARANALNSWSLVHHLRKQRIDTALLLTNSLRSAALAWLSGAKRRIGYARDWRSWLLTDALQAPRTNGTWQPISAVDYYLDLATAWGCSTQHRQLELACTPQDQQLAEHAWQQLKLSPRTEVIAFCIAGGGNGAATAKGWPSEHFVQLAQRIVHTTAAHVLVLCGPNERDSAREIVRAANHDRVMSLAEFEPSIGLTKGVLQRCRLLVSTDSGPRHIATALNVPTIGLFGATDPRWAETYHPQGVTLFNQLPCGPCGKKHCPLGHHDCMRQLTVDRVFSAVQQQLALPQVRAA